MMGSRLMGLGQAAGAPTTIQALASEAGAAMTALAAKAGALRVAATSAGVAGLAEEAVKFATGRGPRLIQEARNTGDSSRLMVVQKVTRNIMRALEGEVSDAVINRFLLLTIPIVGPAAALAPTEVLERVKQEVQEQPIPDPFKDTTLPLSVKIGLGFAGLFVIAYFVRALK